MAGAPGSIQGTRPWRRRVLGRAGPWRRASFSPASRRDERRYPTFGQHAMENVRPRSRCCPCLLASLRSTSWRESVLPRGDIARRRIAAADRPWSRCPTCTTRRRPSSAASRAEGFGFRSLRTLSSSRMRTSCSSASPQQPDARVRRRGRHPGLGFWQASAGEIETGTMFGEHALELGDGRGRSGVIGDGDAPGAIGAQQRMEIEISRGSSMTTMVVFGTERKAADKIERLRARIRHEQSEPGSASTARSASRNGRRNRRNGGIAERLVILAPGVRDPRARPKRKRPAGRRDRAPRNRQPARRPGQRKFGRNRPLGVPIDPTMGRRQAREEDRGSETVRRAGRRPATKNPEPPPGNPPRPSAAETVHKPSDDSRFSRLSSLTASSRTEGSRRRRARERANSLLRPRMNPAVVSDARGRVRSVPYKAPQKTVQAVDWYSLGRLY